MNFKGLCNNRIIKAVITVILCISVFAVSFALFIAETFVLQNLGWIREPDIYVFLVPTVFFMFCTVSNIELKERKIYRYLREQSTLIFFLHLWVSAVLNLVLEKAGFELNNSALNYVVVVVATILISHIIIILSRKFKWIKKLYT